MSVHQAEADTPDPMSVADPLDAANSTNRGTNPIAAYEAELAAALAAEPDTDTQGDEPVVETVSDEPTEEETATEEVAEENEEISDENGEVAKEEEEPEAKAKDRFRFKDPNDQKVAAVAKAMGVSLIEAAKIVEGANPTKHQELEAAPRESVADVTASIKDLQAQKREMLSALDFDGAGALEDKIDELRDKRDELKFSEVQEQSKTEQKQVEKFYSDYAENEAKTVKFYPDAAKANSPMAKEMQRLEAEMLELGDPLYHSAEKPFALAKAAAMSLGIPMTNPNQSPVAKKAATTRPIQPASGNARTTATAPAVRQEEAIKNLGTDLRAYEKFVAGLRA